MVEPTLPGEDIPEADLIEQHTPIEDTDALIDEDTGGALPPSLVPAAWDADEADQLEQAITVPLPDDERAEDLDVENP